jgi:hypothetical protein
MKKVCFAIFSIIGFIILSRSVCQASEDIIWRIGNKNYSSGEFSEFPTMEIMILPYLVDPNWQERSNWGDFPQALYPGCNSEDNPKEIRINHIYLQDYGNPTLRIGCIIESNTTIPADANISLLIFKGDREVSVGKKSVTNVGSFPPHEFPLGSIEKGLHDKNRITIRCSSPNDALFVRFDFIDVYIDDTDTDGDGVSDVDEGKDYAQNQSIASIPLADYDPDPWNIIKEKRITLFCESGEASTCFRQVGFIDPDTLNVPEWLMADRFLPYGFFEFTIEEMNPQALVLLTLKTTEPIYSSVQCHTYQDVNGWQGVNYELIDEHTVTVRLGDGGPEDGDGIEGSIYSIMCLSYPQGLDAALEHESCFMRSIGW